MGKAWADRIYKRPPRRNGRTFGYGRVCEFIYGPDILDIVDPEARLRQTMIDRQR